MYLESIINTHKSIKDKNFLEMLSRTVMELQEPEVIKYNINHKENSDKELLLWGLLYKLKVVMTNMVLKFIIKKVLTRSSFRIYTPYIATIGTGLWDGIVFYKTMRESQYKIIARLVILYLLEHKENLLIEQNYIKVILARYFYYGEYNNNLDYLLGQIYKKVNFNYIPKEYLNDNNLKLVNRNFLLLLYALKEKKYTRKEKEIIEKIDDNSQFKLLQQALKSADCHYLYKYIDSEI
jgi:hypothetical protein